MKHQAAISVPKNSLLSRKYIPDFLLSDLQGNRFESKEIKGNLLTLIVFFSPSDCPSCLLERELWNTMARNGNFAVLGIARHSDRKELDDWVRNSGILFRVLLDEKGEVTKKFGIEETPIKIIADGEGKILLADKARITLIEQRGFIDKANEALIHKRKQEINRICGKQTPLLPLRPRQPGQCASTESPGPGPREDSPGKRKTD